MPIPSVFDRLPDELVTEILLQYLSSHTPIPLGRDQRSMHLRAAIMLVCTRFRDVVYGDGAFWQGVTITSPGVMKAAMTRSGTRPLSVDGCLDRQDTREEQAQLLLIADEAERIRSLNLVTSRELLSLWKVELPKLEVLALEDTSGPDADDNEEFDLLKYFRSPYLKILCLDGLAYKDIKPMFAETIQELEISEPRGDITAWRLLTDLRAMPNLRKLTVAFDMAEGAGTHTVVEYPHLESLTLKMSGFEEAEFLRYLDAPRLLEIRLNIFAEYAMTFVGMMIARRLLDRVAANQQLDTAMFHSPGARQLYMSLMAEGAPRRGIHLAFKKVEHLKSLISCLHSFFLGQYLGAVCNLILPNGKRYIDGAATRRYELFEAMCNVRRLRIEGWGSNAINSGLDYRREKEKEYRAVFPHLKTLELDSVRFWQTNAKKGFIKNLIKSFKHRKAQPLKLITVTNAVRSKEGDLSKLQNFAEKINWDGVESSAGGNSSSAAV
ncbi:hypothetical protein GLOTRDRAFT_131685 [Gloeophyllum trabeum ATCC 11539]|uniref:F-box domain-containing protein n=1 Tax=Gloeophyllum trabeum (strain ATCC 11539 / FP-39264 / Madison 617) TaxID=670483 RepID=S7RIM6_GLOTA|nr:uncharacterized protein GLOTRDRAFT_131685 [Gloeophyllum trabeum ATCC 11539]EPQ52444.1 hypothetical protein GLOTRDRAFT_131685 [Gloeophyllum trabeum ATCC 11539]